MGIYLVSIWLAVGTAVLIFEVRLSSAPLKAKPMQISLVALLFGATSGLASVPAAEPWSSALVWLTMAIVNAALANVAWISGPRLLSGSGLGMTSLALVLIGLRSFASLPAMVAGGVLCVGAALISMSAARSASANKVQTSHT